MKTNKTKVRAQFAREPRFEVVAAPSAPFRATHETDFEQLKERLLNEQLELTPDPALNAPLRRAANEAAALAWINMFPLLVFPVLFQEKTKLALRHAKRQARILDVSRELLAA